MGRLKFADDRTRISRLATCFTCEARNAKLNTCTVCGCYLPAKTRLEKSECPMDMWER
jgi:hypothetical protein